MKTRCISVWISTTERLLLYSIFYYANTNNFPWKPLVEIVYGHFLMNKKFFQAIPWAVCWVDIYSERTVDCGRFGFLLSALLLCVFWTCWATAPAGPKISKNAILLRFRPKTSINPKASWTQTNWFPCKTIFFYGCQLAARWRSRLKILQFIRV